MTEEQKQAIIESGKDYFRASIIPNHIKNLRKLHLKDFDVNPIPHQLPWRLSFAVIPRRSPWRKPLFIRVSLERV